MSFWVVRDKSEKPEAEGWQYVECATAYRVAMSELYKLGEKALRM